MHDSNQSSTEIPLPNIKQELINLCDSYKEFHHYCAFYCKSSSMLIHRCGVELDADCTEGIARFAQQVIEKSQGIDVQLNLLLRKV